MISIEKARLYEKYRLPYAREVVNDLLEHVGEVQVVADIGAGTGQLMLFSTLGTLQLLANPIVKTWHTPQIQDLFGDGQIHKLSYRQSSTEDWTAFFGAACAGIEAPEPADQEFVQFEIINREVFNHFTINDRIRIDYETQVSYGQPN
jgi:hypothetical protein